jgi:hypothetical protein
MPYFTPKMEARYAFFAPLRSIFNLWQVSIISMTDFHREHGLRRMFRGALRREVEIRACARAATRYHPSSRESFMTLRVAELAMVFSVAL